MNQLKIVLLSVLLLVFSFSANAQVNYGYNFFVDYNVKLDVSTENDSTFLTLIITTLAINKATILLTQNALWLNFKHSNSVFPASSLMILRPSKHRL